ncbi:MAG: hypothetical protein FWH51_05055 [Dehalococcoidia bacterium]|nr:hypothetical protein [Dehalococcoidia bacterium]
MQRSAAIIIGVAVVVAASLIYWLVTNPFTLVGGVILIVVWGTWWFCREIIKGASKGHPASRGGDGADGAISKPDIGQHGEGHRRKARDLDKD